MITEQTGGELSKAAIGKLVRDIFPIVDGNDHDEGIRQLQEYFNGLTTDEQDTFNYELSALATTVRLVKEMNVFAALNKIAGDTDHYGEPMPKEDWNESNIG